MSIRSQSRVKTIDKLSAPDSSVLINYSIGTGNITAYALGKMDHNKNKLEKLPKAHPSLREEIERNLAILRLIGGKYKELQYSQK